MKTARFFASAAILLSVMLTGCATVHYAERPATFDPGADAGLIYFYREKAFKGGAISYAVTENGTELGALRSGTFFIVHATPGTHTYEAKTESAATVRLDVEPGATYYVKGSIKFGLLAGRPMLEETTEEEAKEKISGLKYTSNARKE